MDAHPLDWSEQMDPVILLLDFPDETWSLSDPMPRYVAEYVCADFAYANVQPAHPVCNLRKWAHLPEELAA